MNDKLHNLFTANNILIVDMVLDENLLLYGYAEFSFEMNKSVFTIVQEFISDSLRL